MVLGLSIAKQVFVEILRSNEPPFDHRDRDRDRDRDPVTP